MKPRPALCTGILYPMWISIEDFKFQYRIPAPGTMSNTPWRSVQVVIADIEIGLAQKSAEALMAQVRSDWRPIRSFMHLAGSTSIPCPLPCCLPVARPSCAAISSGIPGCGNQVRCAGEGGCRRCGRGSSTAIWRLGHHCCQRRYAALLGTLLMQGSSFP